MTKLWQQDGDTMILLGGADGDEREELLTLIKDWFEEQVPGQSRRVYVEKVDSVAYGKWEQKGARPWEERPAVFRSAAAASQFIGCKGNPVGSQLSAARAKGQKHATVHGVTFIYERDMTESSVTED